MRTYSGHSTAAASNELYRNNLSKGQTGLSIAFDLPTQTGYDPDDPLARGEVGKVGVPITHLGDMSTLLDGIPVDSMNTSMTINATAPWLLGLYCAHANDQNVPLANLRGTTQNDIVKEYLSRGTYIFGPLESRRLIVDMVAFCSEHIPKWNPVNVCSYHLQEAGATPVQEIAFSLATAIGILDAVHESGQVSPERFPAVVGSVSFFVNAGIKFVEETAKMRAFTTLWDQITLERYGVTDPKLRRFRYGVQVNSLSLTESQPENNVQRILFEMLAVTLSKDARARSVQLPAWNEALGLPKPWDQQWSLRMQQVLAYETDLLEHEDIFEGSHVMNRLTNDLCEQAMDELNNILDMGGAFESIEEMKQRLVASHTERIKAIGSGEIVVVGVNEFTTTEESPLGGANAIMLVDPEIEAEAAESVEAWRAQRDANTWDKARRDLRRSAEDGTNIMAATIEFAQVGGTTGEWANTLRDIFGEYRAPTGVSAAPVSRKSLRKTAIKMKALDDGPLRFLVAKPGLDGHSNGAEQIAVAARDAGMEVIYEGIRLTPSQIVTAARDEDVDLVGLSILSGSHLTLVPEILEALHSAGMAVPVILGGIVPKSDREYLQSLGIARIFTPADFDMAQIMSELAEIGIRGRSS